MSQIDKQSWDKLSAIIQDSNSIALSTHINADGDGLGSEIAFYYHLQSLKKECRIINSTPIPFNLTVIDPEEIVEKYSNSMNKWLSNVDLMIVFDIGDHRRIGPIGDHVYGNCNVVSIDHHPVKKDNPYTLNLVDSTAPATGYMIWKYFQHINLTHNKLPINIANALYASVVTDTGSFKYQSTSPDTHYMAAHLIESGVHGYEIQKNIYEQRSLSHIKLLGEVIQSLNYSNSGKVVWVLISQNMIKNVNGSYEDVDGLTEFIRAIQGVEISFVIVENPDGTHRVSFRSSGSYTVNDVAKALDGGGHKFAAGARMNKFSIKDVEKQIISQLKSKIKGEF